MKKQIVSRLCYMLFPCSALLLANVVGADEVKTVEVVEVDDSASGLTAVNETLTAQLDPSPSDDRSSHAADESAEVDEEDSGRADRARERANRSRDQIRRGPRGPRDDRSEWSRRRGRPDGPGRRDGREMRPGPGRSPERQMRQRREGRPEIGPRDDWREARPGRPDRFGGDGRRQWRPAPGGSPFGPPRMSDRRMPGPPVAELRQLRGELRALRAAIEALTEQMRK